MITARSLERYVWCIHGRKILFETKMRGDKNAPWAVRFSNEPVGLGRSSRVLSGLADLRYTSICLPPIFTHGRKYSVLRSVHLTAIGYFEPQGLGGRVPSSQPTSYPPLGDSLHRVERYRSKVSQHHSQLLLLHVEIFPGTTHQKINAHLRTQQKHHGCCKASTIWRARQYHARGRSSHA